MRLSGLQKYILGQCYLNKNGLVAKADFYGFYPKEEFEENKKSIQDIIHNSLEGLVAKDLLVAFGRKTAKKWFINKVKLTPAGKRAAKEIIKQRQRKLPIK
ncbi:MAG: hypothetical protein PHZ04_01065 [Patescibacteria group bacterium]|nr:hypothetical protein [Patescibacteria group bacterium]MDD5295023.1 hypothetical protein [Patescibacteria group bacterium]MDD5554428.1 hypothetical protein [Patescibacteria group bacterium]